MQRRLTPSGSDPRRRVLEMMRSQGEDVMGEVLIAVGSVVAGLAAFVATLWYLVRHPLRRGR